MASEESRNIMGLTSQQWIFLRIGSGRWRDSIGEISKSLFCKNKFVCLDCRPRHYN